MIRRAMVLFMALACIVGLAACSSGGEESPTGDIVLLTPDPSSIDTPDVDATEETAAPSDTPSAEPTVVDWVDIRMAVDIDLSEPKYAAPTIAENAGWYPLGQSTKIIPGSVTGVDDYKGDWVISFDGEGGETDYLSKFATYQLQEIYRCPEEYPNIDSVCWNTAGVQWIEHNDASWRLQQLRGDGQEPVEIANGALIGGALPAISAPEHYKLLLYELKEDRTTAMIRVWDEEQLAWHENVQTVYTSQRRVPQAVESWVSWVEQTSRGWAVVSYNYQDGTKQVFILGQTEKPSLATYDGQLLQVLLRDALYACDVPTGEVVFVSGGIQCYQHIPMDGAIIGASAERNEAVRFQFYPNNGFGRHALIPLTAVKDDGQILSVYHHSYEIDVEMLLVEREGVFEQTTVTLQKREG